MLAWHSHKTLGLKINTASTRHWCTPVIPAPGRLEAEGSEVQGHYQLHREFEANMGYRDLKEKLTNKENLPLSWKMKNLVRGTNSVTNVEAEKMAQGLRTFAACPSREDQG